MAIVRRIGMPENDSETRAIRRLAKGLPDNYLVFHNFDLAYIPDAPNLSIAKTVREHFDRRYVAPAVWLNPRDAVPASDIYSLGMVFYTVITGQPPRHDVETVLETNEIAIDVQLLEHELSRSDSPNFMKAPADAAQVIARMCAPQRSERYASLDELLDDLAIVEA
jgi:serine/threonine protein kinase